MDLHTVPVCDSDESGFPVQLSPGRSASAEDWVRMNPTTWGHLNAQEARVGRQRYHVPRSMDLDR